MKALGHEIWTAETKKKRRQGLYSVPWAQKPQ